MSESTKTVGPPLPSHLLAGEVRWLMPVARLLAVPPTREWLERSSSVAGRLNVDFSSGPPHSDGCCDEEIKFERQHCFIMCWDERCVTSQTLPPLTKQFKCVEAATQNAGKVGKKHKTHHLPQSTELEALRR